MTTKEKAVKLISKLPDDVTASDIIAELYVQLKVETGLEELEGGKGVSHAEAKKRLKKWTA